MWLWLSVFVCVRVTVSVCVCVTVSLCLSLRAHGVRAYACDCMNLVVTLPHLISDSCLLVSRTPVVPLRHFLLCFAGGALYVSVGGPEALLSLSTSTFSGVFPRCLSRCNTASLILSYLPGNVARSGGGVFAEMNDSNSTVALQDVDLCWNTAGGPCALQWRRRCLRYRVCCVLLSTFSCLWRGFARYRRWELQQNKREQRIHVFKQRW